MIKKIKEQFAELVMSRRFQVLTLATIAAIISSIAKKAGIPAILDIVAMYLLCVAGVGQVDKILDKVNK